MSIDKFLEMTDLPPLLVATGSHLFDHDLAISHVRKLFRQTHGEDGEIVSFDSEEISLSALVGECSSTGFFSSAKLCILRRYPAKEKEEARLLSEWLSCAPPDTYIFVSAPDARSNAAFLKALPDSAAIYAFPEPNRQEYSERARNLLRSSGLSFDPAPRDLLVKAFEGNLAGLSNEIEKVRSWLGDRKTVKEADLKAVSSAHVAANKFGLVDSIANGRKGEALELLEKVLREGEQPHMLLATIVTEVRKLLATAEWMTKGLTEKEIGTRLRLKFGADKHMDKARVFTRRKPPVEILRLLVEADRTLKTTPRPPENVLVQVVVQLCEN
ncbi:MAG: hypothetical protein Kow00107_08390 [Planctomycetota bacterium]